MFDALGARRKLLIAHDWGAVIAWVTAMRRAVDLDGLVALPLGPSKVGLQGLVLLFEIGDMLEVIPHRVEREVEDHSSGNADTDPEQNLPGYVETEQLE
jgi:pimeloyl-ACP methyl ester carboxylesterase